MSQQTQAIPLIDGPDCFEVVRDKIGEILALESAAQVVLATAAGRPSPSDWNFDVYLERARPWEAFRDGDSTTPIINIWMDNSKPIIGESNRSTRQKHMTRYNVDIYAYSKAVETVSGHTPGDQGAAFLSHHTVRLVRNILMHDKYTYLGLRNDPDNPVSGRWISDFTVFQPASSSGPIQNVIAARIALDVDHYEIIDLGPADGTVEIINVEFRRGEDDLLIAELEYTF